MGFPMDTSGGHDSVRRIVDRDGGVRVVSGNGVTDVEGVEPPRVSDGTVNSKDSRVQTYDSGEEMVEDLSGTCGKV